MNRHAALRRHAVLFCIAQCLALAPVLTAQAGVELAGSWLGPLELTVENRRGPIPSIVAIEVKEGDVISGDWRSLPPNNASGTLSGRVSKDGTVLLTVVMYADAGSASVVTEPERCVGEARFSGKVSPSGILRLTAKSAEFNLPGVVAKGRGCSNLRDLIWTLQRPK